MRTLIVSSGLLLTLLLTAVPLSREAKAASATATASQTVIAAISIVKTSDLNFGTAPQGDPAKVLATSDPLAAGFTVSGDPNRAYTITLPAGSISMTTNGGGANKEIVVSSFTSNPNGTGTIGASGTQSLKVGATRAALANTQVAGNYSATFTVSVIY